MQINLHGVCLVTLQIYSKSPIIQVRPCVQVTCQVLVVAEPIAGLLMLVERR